jgi:hypothetical protein
VHQNYKNQNKKIGHQQMIVPQELKKGIMETSNMCTRQTFKWQNLHLSIIDDKFAPKQ